jgi:cyclin-dependent kinase 10
MNESNNNIKEINSKNLAIETKIKLKTRFFVNCRSVEDFEKIEELGEGTYGVVCKNKFYTDKSRDKKDNKIYALKQIRMDLDADGFPVTSIREIKLLSEINHLNIIKLKEVVVGYKKDR